VSKTAAHSLGKCTFILFGGIWTQGLTIARQALYHLSHSPALLCVGYFQDKVSFLTVFILLFLNFFNCFFIYSCVHTLFGPFLPCAPCPLHLYFLIKLTLFIFCCTGDLTQGLVHSRQVLYRWPTLSPSQNLACTSGNLVVSPEAQPWALVLKELLNDRSV
jgi:hypothetical protein